MPKPQQRLVEIRRQQVLVHGNHGKWKWRAADWSSHIRSVGTFRTKADAIENARSQLNKAAAEARA